MKEPSFRCVDMLTSFPLLRDELERLANQRIREFEVKTKSQLNILVDCQLAYMNTNHEDFIGFNRQVLLKTHLITPKPLRRFYAGV
ncbi:unnamed protein product [Dibothriocephalus latus]|uniref:Dynamin stalk domain-containing protein n=1 Tax=Dibothriocephalus latus TaxID=60516 RepID=A0A3P7NBQ8_DIBLA|nr:unnamed protein product [Dibothriocephalus latus]